MMRTQAVKLTRAPFRQFTVAAVRRAEGDLGGTRSGGAASGDAFTKREQASEAKYIREREREALTQLKAKLAEQKKHLEELENHIKHVQEQSGGGEQH